MEVAKIYTQFHKSLLNFIRSKIRSKEDAEDILQNVFVKISSTLSTLSKEEKLQSWLFTITRNAIIDYYRVNGSKKFVTTNLIFEEDTFDQSQPDTIQGLDGCLNSMIDLLPESYRDIIIDSELKGIKQKELALKYNMAYPSLRSRVQRGRERLKEIFRNCCHIETDRFGNVLEARNLTTSNCNSPCNPD